MFIYVMNNRNEEKFVSYTVFCVSLVDVLSGHVYPSIDVYIVKNSGLIHLSSYVNLDHFSFVQIEIFVQKLYK